MVKMNEVPKAPMNKYIKYVLFLLLFTPLLGFVYKGIFNFPRTIINAIQIYVLIVGIIFILKYNSLKIPSYVYLLLLYSFYRFFFAVINLSHEHYLTILHYATYNISTLLIIIIIYNSQFNDVFIEKITKIFKLTVIFAFVAVLVEVYRPSFLGLSPFYYSNSENISPGGLYQVRRVAIFGYVDASEIGLSFIPFASVILGHLLKQKKAIIYFMIAVGTIALLTNARYIIIGFLIISIQYLLYGEKSKIKYVGFIILPVIAFFVLYYLLNALGYNIMDWWDQRLFAEGSIKNTTRYKAWWNFIYFFPQNPYWGTGIHGNTTEIARASILISSSQIHVGYFAHLVSFGLIGSFFYFGFLFLLTKNLFTHAKKTKYWGAFFAYIFFLWAQATLVYHSIFFSGLIFALVYDKYYYDNYLLSKENYNN